MSTTRTSAFDKQVGRTKRSAVPAIARHLPEMLQEQLRLFNSMNLCTARILNVTLQVHSLSEAGVPANGAKDREN